MRASRPLRTALLATGVTAALGACAAALDTPAATAIGRASRAVRAKRVRVKTVRLADKVSRAKVYRAGGGRFEAELWADGVRYGALHTQGRAAYARNDGLHVTLHPDGRVTSWTEDAKPRPRPVLPRVLVATPTLADGTTTAKVYRVADDHHEADLYADGARVAALVAEGRTVYGMTDGLRVALAPHGPLSSWPDPDSPPGGATAAAP